MADNIIHLKIVIDGKEVSAELKEADLLLGKLKKNTKGASDETKKFGDASKQDIGRFSGELLNAVGATGKLGSHLNNLATGLATGGMIGVAFAGASALVSALVENTQKWSEALKAATNQLIEIRDPLQNLKFKIDTENLDDLIREVEGAILNAQMNRTGGRGSNFFSDIFGGKSEGEEAAEKILEKLEEELTALKAKKVIADVMNKLVKDENKEWDAQGKSIAEINMRLEDLNDKLLKETPHSAKYKEINIEIEKLKKLLADPFSVEESKLKESQRTSQALLKTEKDNELFSIALKVKHFGEMIALYKQYGKDIVNLTNQRIEAEAELEKKRKEFLIPNKPIDIDVGTPEDIILKDLVYGNIVDYARFTKQQELDLWYSTEEKKVKLMENSEEIMIGLDIERARRQKDLEKEVMETRISAAATALGFISGATAEHTAFHKIASAAQATISTYTAAVEALKAGPILGPIFAAIITGLGMKKVADIMSVKTPKATGYATGGFAMFGERGPEIVAPVTDYAKGQALLVAHTISTLRNMSPLGGGNNMQDLISEIRGQNTRIEKWNRDLNFRFKSGEFVSGSNKALAKYNDLKF